MRKQDTNIKQYIKKIKRISLSLVLAAALATTGIPATSVHAAKAACESYEGSNVEHQNYSVWSYPMKSYLSVLSDGTLMRVQYGSAIEGLLVEYYDAEYNVTSSVMVPEELPLFGGFYATDTNYYIVTGQTNAEESPTVEVYRITKYDKEWNRIASVGLSDCNTTIPFDAGSCRMDVCDKYLLIRTSHEMYTSEDGLNHQANVTIQVDTENMTITDSYTDVMNNIMGYVSHSFNQFIKIEDNHIVSVDHGDAYPRSIALLKYQTDVSEGSFCPDYFDTPCSVIDVMAFPGSAGDNITGASVGGFEISDSAYLVAGNSVVQDSEYRTRTTRNVFVAAVDKDTSTVQTNWLTSYEEGDGTVSTPHMVKISSDSYMVLWSREEIVYYALIDGTGALTSEIYSMDGQLSDCVPVISGDKMIWYTWKNGAITFYDIQLSDLKVNHKTEILNGHDYENQGVADGVATLKCIECQEEKEIKVITSMEVWWNTDGGYSYSSAYGAAKKVGDKLYYLVAGSFENEEELETNEEIEVLSSNDSVATVSMENATNGVISFVGAGEVTITVFPKYNPNCVKTYTITVTGSEEGGSGGNESGGSESGGNESGGNESGGNESGGNESGGSESGGSESGGNESGGNETGGNETDGNETGGNESNANENTGNTGNSNTNNNLNTNNANSGNTGSTGGSSPTSGNTATTGDEGNTAIGDKVVQNGITYEILKAEGQQFEVVVESADSNKKVVAIPDTIIVDDAEYKVTAISAKAFYKNTKIKQVTIGTNVKAIGKKAFYKCKNLKKMEIQSLELQSVGKQAIKGIHKKAVIKAPKKKVMTYKKLFSKKTGMVKSIKIKK